MSDASQAYSVVLADLRARIAEHQHQIDSLNTAVQVLTLAAPSHLSGAAVPQPEAPVGRFTGMSYRKAILIYMSENPSKAYDTATVSEALQAGGMTTKGLSFTSNVSATLSDMVKKHGELIRTDEGFWKLTSPGYFRAVSNPEAPLVDSAEIDSIETSQQPVQ